MKITSSQVTRYTISGLINQDPIVFIFEDFGPGSGRAIVECFGTSWSHFWPAMGAAYNMAKFFSKASTDYLAGKLFDGSPSEPDFDRYTENLKKEVLTMRRSGEITREIAREAYDLTIDDYWQINENWDLLTEILSDPHEHIPEKDKTDYVWLGEIIEHVKAALKELGLAEHKAPHEFTDAACYNE